MYDILHLKWIIKLHFIDFTSNTAARYRKFPFTSPECSIEYVNFIIKISTPCNKKTEHVRLSQGHDIFFFISYASILQDIKLEL